ncbi:hypothetical protein FB107DRAFT_280778 [Schizophyllum commune]
MPATRAAALGDEYTEIRPPSLSLSLHATYDARAHDTLEALKQQNFFRRAGKQDIAAARR